MQISYFFPRKACVILLQDDIELRNFQTALSVPPAKGSLKRLYQSRKTTYHSAFFIPQPSCPSTNTPYGKPSAKKSPKPPNPSRCSPAFCTSPYCATTASPACSPSIYPANYPAAPWMRARSMKPLCAC